MMGRESSVINMTEVMDLVLRAPHMSRGVMLTPQPYFFILDSDISNPSVSTTLTKIKGQ